MKEKDNTKEMSDTYDTYDSHGLQNRGSTCFANSLIQILRRNSTIQTHIKRSTVDGSPWSYFCQSIRELERGHVHHIDPILQLLPPSFSQGQQDAYECWTLLWDKLSNSLPTELRSLFRVVTRVTLTCQSCNHTRNQEDVNEGISMNLPPSGSTYLLRDMFRYYFQPQRLVSRCDHCKTNQSTIRSSIITQWPNTLVIHVNRAIPPVKRLNPLRHPHRLELSTPDGPIAYERTAVMVHLGSFENGHYQCAVRQPYLQHHWVECNDLRVHTIKHESDLETLPMYLQQSYMLFYEKQH